VRTNWQKSGIVPDAPVGGPGRELNLIVSFGDGFRAQAIPGAGELSSYISFVAGMHDRPSRTAHDGRQLGIQIRLDPLGAFSLFGVPLHELGNRVVELAELLGPDGERWAAQLSEARTWDNRFALLDRLLTDRIAAGPMPSPELAWAWRTMRDAGGAVRVADLADGSGCSHRHLVARFREQIGATPKTAARVLRYAWAARLLARRDLAPAQAAVLCGYADQPHMTREFAALAGTTPGAVAATDGLDDGGGPSARLIRRSVSFKTSPARRPTVPSSPRKPSAS
jgi:AraC-like DNA-binding protein